MTQHTRIRGLAIATAGLLCLLLIAVAVLPRDQSNATTESNGAGLAVGATAGDSTQRNESAESGTSIPDGDYALTARPEDRRAGDFVVADGEPGKSFHDAPLVRDGIHGGDLRFMDAHYYRIPLRTGQELHASALIQKAAYDAYYYGVKNVSQTFHVVIYDRNFLRVAESEAVVEGNPTTAQSVGTRWTPDHDTIAYVGVSASHNRPSLDGIPDEVDPATYQLSLRVEGEVMTPIDGNDIPQIAARQEHGFQNIEPFDMPGRVGGDLKLDETVYFGVNARQGESLRISAAVTKPWYDARRYSLFAGKARYTLVVYNAAFEKLGEETVDVVGNRPDGHSVTVDVPVDLDGIVYIGIGSENTGADPVEEPAPGWVTVQAMRASP